MLKSYFLSKAIYTQKPKCSSCMVIEHHNFKILSLLLHGYMVITPNNFKILLSLLWLFTAIISKFTKFTRNSMLNCEISFPLFSETIYTILKIFSQHFLKKSRDYFEENKMLEFFCYTCLARLTHHLWILKL